MGWVLEKVSKSVRDVMGPLSKSWLTLDEAFKTTADSVSSIFLLSLWMSSLNMQKKLTQ